MSCSCQWLSGGPAVFTPSAETDEKYETLISYVFSLLSLDGALRETNSTTETS